MKLSQGPEEIKGTVSPVLQSASEAIERCPFVSGVYTLSPKFLLARQKTVPDFQELLSHLTDSIKQGGKKSCLIDFSWIQSDSYFKVIYEKYLFHQTQNGDWFSDSGGTKTISKNKEEKIQKTSNDLNTIDDFFWRYAFCDPSILTNIEKKSKTTQTLEEYIQQELTGVFVPATDGDPVSPKRHVYVCALPGGDYGPVLQSHIKKFVDQYNVEVEEKNQITVLFVPKPTLYTAGYRLEQPQVEY